MSNCIEYNGTLAFHPGYYIKEIIEDLGISQQDFAKRLGTTPKTISVLIKGEQRLSADIALKLSKMLGTSPEFWLNLQDSYDTVLAEIDSIDELARETEVLKQLDYGYFRTNFNLPDLPRRLGEQVVQVRKFLKVASLAVLRQPDFSASFRSSFEREDEAAVVRSNTLLQIAVNEALEVEAPKFDRARFKDALNFALSQTTAKDGFYEAVREEFRKAGVIFIILPNLKGSKMNGATKRINGRVLLMVNDRRSFLDTFWFTLMHEAGHIVEGDFGISLESDAGDIEERADAFARDALINPTQYASFVSNGVFSVAAVRQFARAINRDPGIVVGRLQSDYPALYKNPQLNKLKTRCRVTVR